MSCNHLYSFAKARIIGDGISKIRGEVNFFRKSYGVLVEAKIFGLPKSESGFFAFHIHEGNNCGGKDFSNTQGHFNPEKKPHPEHVGDLPPLLSCGGEAYMQVLTDRFDINEIIGKTVVIHSHSDDFTTQPSGNAGAKIACGVISIRA